MCQIVTGLEIIQRMMRQAYYSKIKHEKQGISKEQATTGCEYVLYPAEVLVRRNYYLVHIVVSNFLTKFFN